MRHHYHHVHARLRGAGNQSSHQQAVFTPGSLSPAQILRAYGFQQNQFKGIAPVKLGIGSLGGGIVQADIDNSVAAWGMAAPKLTVLEVGGAKNDPTQQGSNVENMLDLIPTMGFAWWWLTGTPADVTMCFGPNETGGMTTVTDALVKSGVSVASWSWGSAASGWDHKERESLAAAFARAVEAGCTFCAASGDHSVDDGTSAPSPDYPCSDPNVWAVGGTRVILNHDGTIATESAWGDSHPRDAGGGGGFDRRVHAPQYQQGIVPGPHRGVPDSSANADPNSGWQISANGSWTVVGGTSAAAPFTAALIAVAKGAAKKKHVGLLLPDAYKGRATAFNDIRTGSNGQPAKAGWDEATGLGSPAGAAFMHALSK